MANGKEIRDLLIKIKSTGGKEAFKMLDDIDKKVDQGINKNLRKTNTNLNTIGKTIKRRIADFEELKAAAKGTSSLGVANRSQAQQMKSLATSMASVNNALNTLVNQQHSWIEEQRASADISHQAAENMEEYARETAGATKAQSKFTKANNKLGNQLKHTNGKGRGQAKMFSALTSSGGGVVGMYAALAANVFILDQGFRVLKESASLVRLEENIGALGNGRNLRGMAAELQDVAKGALSADEALRTAARGAAYGFDGKQMTEFTEVAKKASIALGIEFNDALTRITKGIAKQEVELLDELGIVTRLEPAMAKYAGQIGKTVAQLTDFERTQALANEVLLQADEAYGKINSSSTEYEILAANVSTVSREIAKTMSSSLAPILAQVNKLFDNYNKNLKEISTQEGNVNAGEMANGMTANANAVLGTKEAVDAYTLALAGATKNVEAYTGRQLASEIGMQAWIRAVEKQKLAQDDLTKAKAAYAKTQKESKGFTSEDVKSFEALQNSIKDTLAKINTFSVAAKKGLVSYESELSLATSKAQEFAEEYVKLGDSGHAEVLAEEEKVVKALNNAYGTSYKTVQDWATAVENASKSATSFTSDVQLMEARNWNLKESVSEAEKLALINARIADEEARGNKIGVKQLKTQKQTSEITLKELQRQEKKTALDALYAQYQAQALTSAEAGGQKQSEMLEIQIYFLNRRLEMEDQVLTNLEKQALAREKDLLIQQQQVELNTEKTRIGGSESLTGLFGNKDLADNQANKNNNNEEAIMEHGAAGVSSALDALSSLDSATGQIANGFLNLGQIMAQSMQNGSFGADSAAASISAVAGVMSGINAQAVSEIDHQIAMEKKRDGQSAKSVAKLKELEKKKLKEQQKAKLQSAIMSTASGIASALELPFPYNLVAAGITGAMGLAQISAIRSQGKNASALAAAGSAGNQSIEFGSRMNNVDISQSASAGERAFVTGQAGSGTNANNFIGAASGAHVEGGTAVNVGERGGEVFIPDMPGTIVPSGDIKPGTGGSGMSIQIYNDNIDAQSMIDRSEDILEAIEVAMRAKYGKSMEDV